MHKSDAKPKTTDSFHAIDTPEGIHMRADIEEEGLVDEYQVLDFTVTIRSAPDYVIDDIQKISLKGRTVKVTICSHLERR